MARYEISFPKKQPRRGAKVVVVDHAHPSGVPKMVHSIHASEEAALACLVAIKARLPQADTSYRVTDYRAV